MGGPQDDQDFDFDAATTQDEVDGEQPNRAERKQPRAAATKVSFQKPKRLRPQVHHIDDPDAADFSLDDGDDEDEFDFESDIAEVERVERDDVWAGFTGNLDVPTFFDRINEAQLVLGLLSEFLQSSSVTETHQSELSGIAERVARLDSLELGSDDEAQLRDEIESDLEEIEERIVETERRMPASWLRRQFDGQHIDEATLAHYLRFQLEHLDATPECWSRIDLIITRLSRRVVREDYHLPREPERLIDLWNKMLPPSKTDRETREAAVGFFDNATARLEEFTDADEIFSTGYYVDVAGYKISLRLNYFDPPILYAAAKTNIALQNWLAAQEKAGRNLDALGSRFAEAHEQIRQIFTRQEQDFEAIARFRARMFGKDEPEPEPKEEPIREWKDPLAPAKGWGRKAAFGLALVAALAIGVPVVMSSWETSSRDLEELPASELQSIHPILSKGSLGGGSPPKLLIGELDSSRWVLLNQNEKRQVVEALKRGMGTYGVKNATIYRDGSMAIHIVEGKVRVLE